MNVKVIMATNRADTLDPALLRPRRLDRKIEFPLPDRRQKRLVFQVCTAKMNLGDEVDLEDYFLTDKNMGRSENTTYCILRPHDGHPVFSATFFTALHRPLIILSLSQQVL